MYVEDTPKAQLELLRSIVENDNRDVKEKYSEPKREPSKYKPTGRTLKEIARFV